MIAESYGKSMFGFVRSHPSVLQSSCTIVHSHQQRTSTPVAPRLHHHLMLSVLEILAVLIDVEQYLIGLFRNSLMTCDASICSDVFNILDFSILSDPAQFCFVLFF